MPDNRNKTGNQDKQQQQPMKKPGNKNLDKDVGNENRDIQKDVETDETDEQGEITQRNPRQGDDDQRR